METPYCAALELYRTTGLSIKDVCVQAGVSPGGFRAHLYRYHRELVFARSGMAVTKEEAATSRLHKPSGQRSVTRIKYKAAIEACNDMDYIGFNVSQIARMFGLNPAALGNQLRNHYPEILERRERERRLCGVNDNLHRGVQPCSRDQYSVAVEHLRTNDDTIRQTAALYNLSYSGLREHLLYYHKDLVRIRSDKRRRATASKVRGALTGRGDRHEPKPQFVEKYREAVRLYRTTAMTQEEICAETGVTVMGLRNHLRNWNKELMTEHYDVDGRTPAASCETHHIPDPAVALSGTKRYLKSTAAKYAGAIELLKATGRPTADVAKEFGLNPETFREYLHEHEPELAASLGMTKLANGRKVLARSAGKYDEAVRLYETTAEPLKSIALRLGLTYNSLGGFIRRNRPDAIAAHNLLVANAAAIGHR